MGFAESAYSELAYARAIAEQFRTDHHELTVSQEHLMEHLPALVRYRDAPVAEPPTFRSICSPAKRGAR